MLRVQFEEARDRVAELFKAENLDEDDAALLAEIMTTHSLAGVPSHGLHFVRLILSGLRAGRIDPQAKAECVSRFGAWEQWDGHQAPGPLSALRATDRSLELAREMGVGVVAMRNTNHWTRPGYFGHRAAHAGFGLLCWANTPAVMPAWGGSEPKLGNNPIVFAIPNGETPVVLDMALSQFSIGRLHTLRAAGETLPVPGGYDENGELSDDPAAILDSRRSLPIGYWKGAGLALLLDLLGATLAGGNTTLDRTREAPHDSVCQIFIAFDLAHRLGADPIADTVWRVVEDLRASVADDAFRFPGEGVARRTAENRKAGVPVDDRVWAKIVAASDALRS